MRKIIVALFLVLVAVGQSMAQDAPKLEHRPFEVPILNRDVRTVKRLIDQGADINQRMFNLSTPAIKAALSDNWKIVLVLLEAGADAGLEDRMGLTVAELARTSRVVAKGDEGRALNRVREILRRQGLY